MAGTITKKQAKAQRLKDVYESMSDERLKALDEEIQDITSECNDCLQGAAEDAGRVAASRFYELVVRRYTEDEIEAVLRWHNCGGFEYDVYKNLREMWNRHWLPESEQKPLGSIPIRKGVRRD
jgi:hypothetical protein